MTLPSSLSFFLLRNRRGLAALMGALSLSAALPVDAQLVQPVAPSTDLNRHLARLALNPRDLNALTGAGEAALTLGDPRAAVGFFARANDIEPNNGQVKAGMGKALVALQQPVEALRQFAQATRLAYSEREMWVDRGFAYDLTGDLTRAQADYALAFRATPTDPVLVRRYAISLAASGKWQDADTMILPLLNRGDREAWRDRAFIYAMNGLREKARSITQSTMPPPLAASIDPYMDRMTLLSPAQQMAAVHFGQFPAGVIALTPKPPAQIATTVVAAETSRNRERGSSRSSARASRRDRATEPPVRVASADRTSRDSGRGAVAVTATATATATTASVPRTPATLATSTPSVAPRPVAPVSTAVPVFQTPRLIETAPSGNPTPTSPPVPVVAPVPAPAPVSVPAPAPRPSVQPAPIQAPAVLPVPPVAANVAPSIPPQAPSSTPTALPVPPTRVAEVVGPVDPISGPTPGFSSAVAPMATPVVTVASPAPASPVPTSPSTSPPPPAAPSTSGTTPPPVDRTLADIFADIAVPPEEQRASIAPVDLAEVAALQAEKRRIEAEAAVKAKAKAAADAKVKADVEAKAKAKREADEKEKAKKANPARIWVQIATGRDPKALAFDMRRYRKESPALFASKSGWSSEFGNTRRLVIGPFATQAKAKAFLADWTKAGGGGYVWESAEGLEVTPLP